jgi:integrase
MSGTTRPQTRWETVERQFHDLRHTCATLLLTKGVHPKIVSEMLGYSSIAITLDTYSHVIPGLGDAAAGAMEEALGGDTNVRGNQNW